jgi:hypothetical protein
MTAPYPVSKAASLPDFQNGNDRGAGDDENSRFANYLAELFAPFLPYPGASSS